MIRGVFTIILMLICVLVMDAQEYRISGTITDEISGDPLIGATIVVEESGAGTTADIDGKFELRLDKGTYTITVSYVGYTAKTSRIEVTGDLLINIGLENINVIQEVIVQADIAIDRKTPIAFSNIPTIKLQEELAAQDIPLILNSTPGVYATESGGGDGDARISIRGFNQRNIAVMLDGIPVNDMENGWVYWSNWFGLDLVTKTIQVQRGLGASKLSVPSVGGTLNILTKGIEAKRKLRVKQEFGNDGFMRSTIGFSSGRLKNDWSFSLAGSYKQGEGWVDGNFTKGYFYYLRIDKQIGDHYLSLSGFGAPQKHGQRPFTTEIGLIDVAYAKNLGVPETALEGLLFQNKGRRYNEHWGYKEGEVFNTRENFYHKPQFSFRHSWQISEKLFWSNVAYLSIGRGGGTARDGNIPLDSIGQYNVDKAIENNLPNDFFNPNGKSSTIIRASNNDHFWYGAISSFKYRFNPQWTLSGGVDARYYRGDHYRTVYDLLGGNYFLAGGNNGVDNGTNRLLVDDKMEYYNRGFVRWLGAFGLLEYNKNNWSIFLNASAANTGYKLVDFFKPKIVSVADTSFLVSYDDMVNYNDEIYTYNHTRAAFQSLGWIDIASFTFKTGASYNIDDKNSVFFNTGYLSKPQKFGNVINSNRFGQEVRQFQDYDNEKIIAFELGYNYRSPRFSANLNTYYTIWENKPLERPPSVPLDPADPESERINVNIPGIDALHKGIELDFVFIVSDKLTIEGLTSIGDWTWDSSESGSILISDENVYNYDFDAKGVHVGDAAQLQIGGLVRYEALKDLYLKLKTTYFGNHYTHFEPEDLKGGNAGRESWKLPDYTLFSLHTGYRFTLMDTPVNLRANVLNVFDTRYLSDGRNNDSFNDTPYEDFDAKSASVHFGQGRRYTISIEVSF